MAVDTPLLTRRRIVGAKLESNPGTAESLAGSDATILVWDPSIQCDMDVEERMAENSGGQLPGVPGVPLGTFKCKTDIPGAATSPPWATVFLPACAISNTSLVWTPKTRAPSASGPAKSITIGVYEDGLLKVLYGAVGNPVFNFPVGKRAFIEWTFRGIYAAVTDVALVSPSISNLGFNKFFNSSLLWGGAFTPRISNLQFDVGNQLVIRPDGAGATGAFCGCIPFRKPVAKFDPEATLVADQAWYTKLLSGATSSLAWSVGAATNKVAFSLPYAQITKGQEGDREGISKEDLDLMACVSGVGADDDFSITFFNA